MRPVEFLLLLEEGKVLADGHLRNPETLGKLRDRDRTVLLQQGEYPAVPFRQAQIVFFT